MNISICAKLHSTQWTNLIYNTFSFFSTCFIFIFLYCRWLDNNFKFFALGARFQLAKKELKKTFKQSIQCTLKSQTHIIVFYIEIADTNIPIALSNNVTPYLLVLLAHGAKICARTFFLWVVHFICRSLLTFCFSNDCAIKAMFNVHSKFTISTNTMNEWIKPNLRAFTVWSQFSGRCFYTLYAMQKSQQILYIVGIGSPCHFSQTASTLFPLHGWNGSLKAFFPFISFDDDAMWLRLLCSDCYPCWYCRCCFFCRVFA